MLLLVLNTVLKILSLISGVDTLVNIINGKVQQAAQETTAFLIQTNTTETINDLLDPTIGLAKIVSNQATIIADIASARAAILSAVGAPQQTGSPVTLPTTPPSGYGTTETVGGNGTVWGSVFLTASYGNQTAETLFTRIANVIGAMGEYSPFLFKYSPLFYAWTRPDLEDLGQPLFAVPVVDIRTVRPSDTVLSWLTREAPSFTWVQDGTFGGRVYAVKFPAILTWVCTLFDNDLHQTLASSVNVPIWPGLAGVTLGTPQAITPSLVITGPMHGVIIDITSFAPRQAFGDFGTLQGLRFTGALTFIDDNGESERPQSLGSVHEVLLPKSMVVAASCAFKADVAVVGTATPFTIP